MSEEQVIRLPANWRDFRAGYSAVPEGEHNVRVEDLGADSEAQRVTVRLAVVEDPGFAGRKLFENFQMDSEVGVRLYLEFLDVIGVEPVSDAVAPERCRGKKLRVVVRHKEHEGKTYANIVKHLPHGGEQATH